jgi:hydroxymethylglutaryl-CoA reductase
LLTPQGGATTAIFAEGMTRAPLVRVESLAEAAAMRAWIENKDNYKQVEAAFNSTSRFGRLKSITTVTAGRNVYLRFKAVTGDAMGMNMITKVSRCIDNSTSSSCGSFNLYFYPVSFCLFSSCLWFVQGVNEALQLLHKHFPTMKVLSLSGNVCTDKKPSAINWIEGRGKSVSAEVRLSGHVLKTVLKTNADALVDLNTAKNLVGSALAGSVGGFNAHASNIVTAVYLATGQDPAQNVESSTCLTLMEKVDYVEDINDPDNTSGPGIIMTVTMPSVEVGTVGGGTSLPAQAACLELMGLRGSHPEHPGQNASTLARVVAASVLAGELSLMSALTTNDLLSAHIKLNRKPSSSAAHSGPQAMIVNEAMMAKLQEVSTGAAPSGSGAFSASKPSHSSVYTTVHRTAAMLKGEPSTTTTGTTTTTTTVYASGGATGAALNPAGTVPGGAPAGAHAHPLHLSPTSHGNFASASMSPGRRYFAAPATRMSRFGGRTPGTVTSTHASPAPHWTGAGPEGSSFFAGPAISAGVDEENRGVVASAAWDEPRLSVP